MFLPRRVTWLWTFLSALGLIACSGENSSSESLLPLEPPEVSVGDSLGVAPSDSIPMDTVISAPFVGGPVMFTEVDPVNMVYEDHEGGDAGWVELFNTSADSVNLSGTYLTNSLAEPKKWLLGNVVIPPESFMLVFLSGKDYPDFVAPSDSISLVSSACWIWTDAQADPPGESYANNLEGKQNFCFKEDGERRFGAVMRFGENKELGWSSISSFVGAKGWDSTEVVDLSNANEILLRAYITKGRKASLRLVQTGLPDWKGFEMLFTGTGDSSTVYRAVLPQGMSLPDLANIYGTRLSPESNAREEVVVKAFSYLARNRGHEPHANFKIKNKAGRLYLMNGEASIMDSVAYPELPIGKSWSFGGSNWGYSAPSPYGFPQEAVVAYRSPALDEFSLPPSGFYSAPFEVSFPAAFQVHCEIGGGEPTENSPVVVDLSVTSTMALRCASFMPGILVGETLNRTYVFESAPALPAVFVMADSNSLFDPDTGIYVEGPNAEEKEPHFGANYWQDREIPVFVELLEKGEQKPAFGENAGLKIFGNYSRANPKKSVAITFREKYGKNRLNYPLFPEFPELNKFKVFVLRNNGSNFWNDYIRDMLSSSISEGLGVDYQRGRASIVYYNGKYFGIHNIRERSTEYYFETHYGLDPDKIDLLKADNSATAGSSVEYQKLMDWLETHHLDDEENYNYVAAQIDVGNFMNYMHLETFVNNRDWPSNNLKKWRSRDPATPWKWFIYDTDFGFGNNYSEFKNNIFEFATAEDGPSWPNGPESTLLLRRMMENPGFRIAFVNRMAVLLSMNFEPSRTLSRINTLMSAIEPEIARDQKRWKTSASHMKSELNSMKSFAQQRPGVVQGELKEFFGLGDTKSVMLSVDGPGKILVHDLPLDRSPLVVDFFEGLNVVVSAMPDPGYVWMGWSDGVQEPVRIVVPGEMSGVTAVFR